MNAIWAVAGEWLRARLGREGAVSAPAVRLFVYGTLKARRSNHRLLAGATFRGADEAPGVMYGRGVPYVVPSDESWVKGEVYDVPLATLPRVDRLEGHPVGYTRIAVQLRSGRRAEIYYWLNSVRGAELIASGEWD